VKFIYNTAYHSAHREMPFKVVYGHDPPTICFYESGDCWVAAVVRLMADRGEFLCNVRDRLSQAQEVAKRSYDRGHMVLTFAVGDWVWLRLRQLSPVAITTAMGKLRPRFYGPYKILAVINEVAYRLELPPRARIHDLLM